MSARTIAAVLLTAAAAAPALAQPVNDLCADAIEVEANVLYVGSNVTAFPDIIQSPCSEADDADVWYRFTAASAGSFTIDTFGSTFDTTLAVYTACGGANLACNDDYDPGFGSASLVELTFAAGQTVRIRIAGYGFEQGRFFLFITPPPVLSTGACCRGSACIVLTPFECSGAADHFAGVDVPCNAAGSDTAPCCRADFNHAAGVTVQDIYDFLTDWASQSAGGGGPIVLASADFNNSGSVTVQDIYDFLTAWAAGCGG